jgi:glycine/D-amino acid oxidase-like deaminating enzyme
LRRIAVIGGGVTGCSVAWHLKSRGLGDVHLFERDKLGSGTTWHSAGNITWNPQGDYDAPVLYLHDLIARLEEQTGLYSGWRETGRLYLARDAATMDGFLNFHGKARERGIDARLLSPKEAVGYHPLLNASALHGACYNPMSGYLNPAGLVELFARSSLSLGVNIHEHTRIRELSTGLGHLNGVVTGEGERLAFDDVVVCAGLWSADLVSSQDIVLAQGGCEHMYIIMEMPERLAPDTPAFLSSTDLIYGREEAGGFLLGCFDAGANVIDVGGLPDPFTFALLNDNWDKFAPYFEAAAEFFPAFNDAPIRSFINGPEAFTPDGNPFVGAANGLEGLWLCTGMNSHGVTISGATGHIIADLLADTEPRFSTDIYATDRFGEKARNPEWLKQKISESPSGNYIRADQDE